MRGKDKGLRHEGYAVQGTASLHMLQPPVQQTEVARRLERDTVISVSGQLPAGFVGAAGLSVAMHWVTYPCDSLPRSFHSLNQLWQLLSQLLLAHTNNDGQSAGSILGVEGVDHADQVIGIHLVADFDTNRVANAAHELHVCCV